MKRNRVLIIVLLILTISFFAFLLFENSKLREQVEERDVIIYKILKNDEMLDSIVGTESNDTISKIIFLRNEKGDIISYRQLDSLYSFYKKQCEIQDFIILTTKKRFHFDYRIAQHGDTLILDVWDKKYTKQLDIDEDF